MSRSEYVIRLPEIQAQTAGAGQRGDILCTAEGPFDITYWSTLLVGDFARIICYVTGDWATGEVEWSYSGTLEFPPF